MPNQARNIEEQSKIAREAKFATLGRAMADEANAGRYPLGPIVEATTRRAQEQARASKETRFAALARQVGDAARAGTEVDPLILCLQELRRLELGPAKRG